MILSFSLLDLSNHRSGSLSCEDCRYRLVPGSKSHKKFKRTSYAEDTSNLNSNSSLCTDLLVGFLSSKKVALSCIFVVFLASMRARVVRLSHDWV